MHPPETLPTIRCPEQRIEVFRLHAVLFPVIIQGSFGGFRILSVLAVTGKGHHDRHGTRPSALREPCSMLGLQAIDRRSPLTQRFLNIIHRPHPSPDRFGFAGLLPTTMRGVNEPLQLMWAAILPPPLELHVHITSEVFFGHQLGYSQLLLYPFRLFSV